jgi:hypothetical protein
MPPYKREGATPEEAWNELIRRINELVPDCPGVEPLDEVEPNHRWSRSDIEQAQTTLTELCAENTFSAIPQTWKQSIIDELVAAIDNESCCCEEEDRGLADGYIRANSFAFVGGFRIFSVVGVNIDYKTQDWAGWLRQEVEDPFEEEIPLAVGDPIILECGGPAWVGREFRRWEVFVEKQGTAPSTAIIDGPVIDGYIFIGTDSSQALARAWDDALQDERRAIVARASAQAARNAAVGAEAIAAAQAALVAAQSEESAAIAAREAAEAALDGNPESRHTPWIVNSPNAGVWRLDSQGEDAFQQILPASAFQHDRQFMLSASIADRPYTIDLHPVGFVELTLRLLCDE